MRMGMGRVGSFALEGILVSVWETLNLEVKKGEYRPFFKKEGKENKQLQLHGRTGSFAVLLSSGSFCLSLRTCMPVQWREEQRLTEFYTWEETVRETGSWRRPVTKSLLEVEQKEARMGKDKKNEDTAMEVQCHQRHGYPKSVWKSRWNSEVKKIIRSLKQLLWGNGD